MSSKMKRFQIYLEHELDKELGRLATRLGVSKAQLLRDGAWRLIHNESNNEEDPVLSIIALGHCRPGKISEKHDQYLAEQKLKAGKL